MKRDLKADLEICNKAMKGPWTHDGCELVTEPCRRMIADGDYVPYPANMAFIAAAREGWPHAIERAIKAEAALQAKLDNAIDTAFDLEAEIAKLRKVVEAAREYKTAFDTVVANPNKHGMAHYSLMDNMARAETLLFEALDE